jgi:predicted nucleotidyltransferase
VALSPAEAEILAAFKRGLVASFGVRLRTITLFGSRARGEGRDDSDLDVTVDVLDVTRAERGAILDLATDLGVEHGLVLSVVVLREGAARLPAAVLREGIPL